MASEKNERLVNLVIALLATRRFLSKTEIFKAVPGYEGNSNAADRMFERDKEELRQLGIQIETKAIDPLFDDEIGYRILPERYRFDLGPLTTEEVTLLALASEAWKSTALDGLASATSLRLESLGVVTDFSELPLAPTIAIVPDNLDEILDSIEANRIIEFGYINTENIVEPKRVAPYGLYSKSSRWYLYGKDRSNNEFRSYRLDRFAGEIKRDREVFQREEFSLPTVHFAPITATLEIERDKAHELLAKAIIIESDDIIKCKVDFLSLNEALAQVLRNSPHVRAIAPQELVDNVKRALSEIVKLHAS